MNRRQMLLGTGKIVIGSWFTQQLSFIGKEDSVELRPFSSRAFDLARTLSSRQNSLEFVQSNVSVAQAAKRTFPGGDKLRFYLAFGTAEQIGLQAESLLNQAARILPLACNQKFQYQLPLFVNAACQLLLHKDVQKDSPAGFFLSSYYVPVWVMLAKRGDQRDINKLIDRGFSKIDAVRPMRFFFNKAFKIPGVELPLDHVLWSPSQHLRLPQLRVGYQLYMRQYKKGRIRLSDEYKTRYVLAEPRAGSQYHSALSLPAFKDIALSTNDDENYYWPHSVLTMFRLRRIHSDWNVFVDQLNFSIHTGDSSILDVCSHTRDFNHFVLHLAGAEDLFTQTLQA